MIASYCAIVEPADNATPIPEQTAERLVRWLIAAVALDLLLTRIVVPLAIFVPKGNPWATAGAILGRIGAATDVLVPIVGVLLLGALLHRAGRQGDWLDRVSLVAVVLVAASGLALVYLSPTPGIVLATSLLVILVAVGSAVRVCSGKEAPFVACVAVVALAFSVASTALDRALQVSGILAQSGTGDAGRTDGLVIAGLGQVAFTAGAALLGLGGIVVLRRSIVRSRWSIVVGAVVAIGAMLIGTLAPAPWGTILIWSVGLTGAIPLPILALALGLAVAGLPVLHRTAPRLAIGASIVLLAGYGLAASGLLLSSLLGLIVISPIGRLRTVVARP